MPQAELDLSVTWIQSITGVSGQSARPRCAVSTCIAENKQAHVQLLAGVSWAPSGLSADGEHAAARGALQARLSEPLSGVFTACGCLNNTAPCCTVDIQLHGCHRVMNTTLSAICLCKDVRYY